MSAFKDGVYWRNQCDFCIDGNGFCGAIRATKLLVKRLEIAEADSPGCHGTVTFWCDYFRADEDKVKSEQVCEVQA